MLNSVENYVIILHMFMYLMFFKYDRFFFIKIIFFCSVDLRFFFSFHFLWFFLWIEGMR
jgi:hypothetical protein